MIKNSMFTVAMLFVLMMFVVACEPAKAPELPEVTQTPVEASEGFQGVQAPTDTPVTQQPPADSPEGAQMGTGEVPSPSDTQKQSYTMPPMIVN